MAVACIDIGSNTTRLLVADVADGRLHELLSRRAFTRIGSAASEHGGQIPAAKLAEVAGVVAEQAGLAREAGAERIEVVATAAIRNARNGAQLTAAIRARCGLDVRVLTGDEEGRLAFVGATRTLDAAVGGPVAVIDVGGGSTEVAVGTLPGGVAWCRSLPVGSGLLADAYLRGDPPAAVELEALRRHVRDAFDALTLPNAELAVAVGGSAASLRKLVGPTPDRANFERVLALLAAAPAAEVARREGLDAERIRLLPAGISILAEAADRLEMPLLLGRGGLREGILLGLLDGLA